MVQVSYLLDTHVFVWMLAEPGRLSDRALDLVENKDTALVFSVASIWEIAIKAGLGKFPQAEPILDSMEDSLARMGTGTIDVRRSHAVATRELDPHHRDPFDRMLIAQARVENMQIITADPAFRRYDVDIVW